MKDIVMGHICLRVWGRPWHTRPYLHLPRYLLATAGGPGLGCMVMRSGEYAWAIKDVEPLLPDEGETL